MSESLIPLERRWNSWDAEHPAAMRYLPLGLDIDLCAYAASRNTAAGMYWTQDFAAPRETARR